MPLSTSRRSLQGTQVTDLLSEGLRIRWQDNMAAVIRDLGHLGTDTQTHRPSHFRNGFLSGHSTCELELTIAASGTLVVSH